MAEIARTRVEGKAIWLYEQQGFEFVEVELGNHPNITIIKDGSPLVLVRSIPTTESIGINVIDWPGLAIALSRNNRKVA